MLSDKFVLGDLAAHQLGSGIPTHGHVLVDIPILLDSRLLIQANSGGGKSWLLRLMAERIGTQVIVLDPEGEYASLREAVDMLVVGAGGELPAHPGHAALLARRLLEYQVSAVIDLYDLRLSERRRFVALFLDALMHLPRELWRPVFVILDEAHLFAPERGAGEAESTNAVIGLMSQGRKRGFAGVIATQRLSKLHKDVAAEANNVIIGRTWLDSDQIRAGDALGLSKSDRLALRDLGQGEFYAFGPAFTPRGVIRFRSSQVRTTHPRPGQRHLLTPPSPSKVIRAVLEKFADLPLAEETQVFQEISAGELSIAKRTIVDLEERLRDSLAGTAASASAAHEWMAARVRLGREIGSIKDSLEGMTTSLETVRGAIEETVRWLSEGPALLQPGPSAPVIVRNPVTNTPVGARAQDSEAVAVRSMGLAGGERRILTILAQYPAGRRKNQVAILTGYAVAGGGFNNYLSALRTRGLIDGGGDLLRITTAGTAALGSWEPLPRGPALIDYWLARLGKAERGILKALIESWPKSLTKSALATRAGALSGRAEGYDPGGGGFNNALSRLRTLELVSGRGELSASRDLF